MGFIFLNHHLSELSFPFHVTHSPLLTSIRSPFSPLGLILQSFIRFFSFLFLFLHLILFFTPLIASFPSYFFFSTWSHSSLFYSLLFSLISFCFRSFIFPSVLFCCKSVISIGSSTSSLFHLRSFTSLSLSFHPSSLV